MFIAGRPPSAISLQRSDMYLLQHGAPNGALKRRVMGAINTLLLGSKNVVQKHSPISFGVFTRI